MNNLWLLLKNNFNIFLGGLLSKKQKFKYTTALIILGLFSFIFILLFCNMAIISTNQFIKLGQPALALYVNAAMALIFIVLMTVMKSTAPVKSTDEEMLLSLPLKKSEIVISKLFYNYLFDLALVFVTLLPSYITYVVLVDEASVYIVLRGILLILLLPLFSNAIGSFMGIFIQKLASKSKHFAIIQSAVSLLLLILFMTGYYYLNSLIMKETIDDINVIYNFAPIKWMVGFVLNNNWFYFLILFLISFLPFVLNVYLKVHLLGKKFSRYKSTLKELKFIKKSPLKSLCQRELKRYFGCSVYVINTIFGLVVMLILALIILVLKEDYIINLLTTSGLLNLFKNYEIVVIGLFSVLAGMSSITSCSISLEGNSFWVLKANPVLVKDIFLSKILANLYIAFFPIFLSCFLVSFQLGFEYFIFIFLIAILTVLIMSCVGLFINLLYPKFDFDNEMTVVKQSMSPVLTVFIGFAIGLIPLVLYIILGNVFDFFVFLSIIIVLLLFLLVAISIILSKIGKKIFLKL